MSEQSKTGHRQRLRERFLAGEKNSLTEEALLELLLTYAIPQKDVRPLARKLIDSFGNLAGTLSASEEALCRIEGIKSNAAVLLKLVHVISSGAIPATPKQHATASPQEPQPELFAEPPAQSKVSSAPKAPARSAEMTAAIKPQKRVQPGRRIGSQLFAKACLGDAIKLLPGLPDTNSLEEAKEYLRANLHYSAEQTRQRYTTYITLRMFPEGFVDRPLRLFSKRFDGMKDLQNVCLYRFMKAEPLTIRVVEDLLLPAIGNGRISRDRLNDLLHTWFPESKSIKDCSVALVEALQSGGVVKAERTRLSFAYQDIPLAALVFVLHSEFDKPGMYDLAKLENHPAFRALLWNPNQTLPALYELRNRGLISKVSEIDSVRQFTTRYTLDEAVERLVSAEDWR